MQWSSRTRLVRVALLGAVCCSLGACATTGMYGGIDTASIRLDDDGGSAMAAVAQPAGRPGVGTPIAQIMAYPGGRQVLDQDLPGLVDRPEYVFFAHMNLKSLQGMSRGQMKDDDIRKVAADLRALP